MFEETKISVNGIKISLIEDNCEIGRAYIYFLKNNLHKKTFGFLEDVFIKKDFRDKGFGKKLVQKAIEISKKNDCYKLIGTSRFERIKVHDFYKNIGFLEYGKEFRIDL